MPKTEPAPGWSRYTPHKKSNPSNLPPELQDPEYVARIEIEEEKRKQRMIEGINNGCNANTESRSVNYANKQEVFMAVKSHINSNNYLFASMADVVATLSLDLYKAVKKFHLDRDEDLVYEVKRRFAEVKSQRLMDASKDSRNFTTIFKALFADDDTLTKVTPSYKPKNAAEKNGGIVIHMEGGLTEEDIRSAKETGDES